MITSINVTLFENLFNLSDLFIGPGGQNLDKCIFICAQTLKRKRLSYAAHVILCKV